ncbi:hypothetical protein AVEN_170218-1 [Araneus ventricosus]|uniref:Uncharacterized protein n=1 Tax=Araneus ventricosus TaxID=182803 RepID=A0A4Y2UGD9_ARAVE|nr:hypothetical protein AVEN_170218-1 [Araneus ventricosus]
MSKQQERMKDKANIRTTALYYKIKSKFVVRNEVTNWLTLLEPNDALIFLIVLKVQLFTANDQQRLGLKSRKKLVLDSSCGLVKSYLTPEYIIESHLSP